MNIVNKLTIRHLLKNKRRTLVTIIGVIISVAMVTAVATLGLSFMDLLKRQTIADEGEWHVLYKDVNKDQLEALKNDKETKSLIVLKDVGYALLDGSQNEGKPYLFIREYNKQGFAEFPIELKEGRLPQRADEIVISDHIATNAKVNYNIGDNLTFDVGKRYIEGTTDEEFTSQPLSQTDPLQTGDSFQNEEEQLSETLKEKTTKSYTVVGVIKRPTFEPAWAPGYTVLTYVDDSNLAAGDKVNASVILRNINSSLFDHANELAKKTNIDKDGVIFNNELLRYYGVIKDDGTRTMLYSLSAIIMSVIMIGSISLIYNAFAISVSERSRYLGMLASVGATRRQKRNSVLFEGAIIGLVSIPVGLIAGIAGIEITFRFINSIIQGALGMTESLRAVVSPFTLLVAIAVSMLTIFLSTYLPARKAAKISAIDAIRQTADVKLTGKKVKTSKLVRKLFGMEAEIGLKNLKRNKRRYRATVFSLVISIVLFLAVSFYTANLKKSLMLSQDGINFDIQVTVDSNSREEAESVFASISSLDSVGEYSIFSRFYGNSFIEEERVADELREMTDEIKPGYYQYGISVYTLDDHNLREYAEKAGADYGQLTNPENPAAIVIDTVNYQDPEAEKYVETKAIKAKTGQSLEINYTDWETGKELSLGKVSIAALTDQVPMGVMADNVHNLNIIISEVVFAQLVGNNDKISAYDKIPYLYLNSSDPLKTQQEIEEMNSNAYVYNLYQIRQQQEQMLLVMNVFVYGFIILITSICVANIFNTISTSIALRKKEFAMLKSVGMTPKGFTKMINYESVLYGIKSLLYGLPLSFIVMFFIHRSLMNSFDYRFTLPVTSIVIAVAAVFVIVGTAMLYSSAKVKKENIIDALKQENI
ncbi:ABC transporter permease [Bacillaceae bacterium Marseille-Q3522]|nr:ABC transporter permease [Bacillaceae bacterium Marseille-Q3522]